MAAWLMLLRPGVHMSGTACCLDKLVYPDIRTAVCVTSLSAVSCSPDLISGILHVQVRTLWQSLHSDSLLVCWSAPVSSCHSSTCGCRYLATVVGKPANLLDPATIGCDALVRVTSSSAVGRH